MQSGVTAGVNSIGGTLKYVTDYTGFSGDASEQSGNFLALHIGTSDENATIKAKLSGSEEVTLDSDGLLLIRVESNHQKLKITVSADGYDTVTKTYDLTGLRLESAS